MSVTNLRRLEQRFLQDKKITADEAKSLVDSMSDYGAVSKSEKAELKKILDRNTDKLDPQARSMLEKALGVTTPPAPAPAAGSDVIRSVEGSMKLAFGDDTVFLGRDGTVHGDANVSSYTRSYDATKEGPLRFRHGSQPPASSVLTAEEAAAVKKNTPGQALDAAAKIFGASVDGFETMANSKDFYNEDADFWWGKCHAWTWSSLSEEVNRMVDVAGPEGQRGLWIGGQFMSRADLGNWMMGVADEIAINDSNQLFDSNITALDLLKGTTQFLMNNGGGMVSDIFNDKKKGHKEVWNQPFVSSDVTTKSLPKDDTSKQILELAKADGLAGGVEVKQVTVVGSYGNERSDDYEGDPNRSSKTWNMFAVCDGNGKVLTAYMSDDEKLKGVTGLPYAHTDDLPDYIWKPTLRAISDTLAGRPNRTVDNDAHGKEFKFFLQTVLQKGVPATTRTAFESAMAALPAGNVDANAVTELVRKYPGVANGYSPEQWARAFASRGLDAKAFGAAW